MSNPTADLLGLSSEEAARLLREHGPNALPEAPRDSLARQFLEQFANPLILTLLVSAAIALVIGWTRAGDVPLLARVGDATAILLIVLLNAMLGVYQERRAQSALDALKKLSASRARVWRDGERVEVAAESVVPGDVLELGAGDAVAADAQLLWTSRLAAMEAILTGESEAVPKQVAESVFAGTTVTCGRGLARVTATGSATDLGRIGQAMAAIAPSPTPLQQQLAGFGKVILWVCLGLSVVLFAWGLTRGGRPWHELLLEAVSLAVAAIPEGLPAVTTITLALGMLRMARRGALVRKLAAVETLGAATVICVDKTGTLTQNQMTVTRLYVPPLWYDLDAEGNPVGEAVALLRSAALCNDAELRGDQRLGDPTEIALLVAARRFQVSVSGWERVAEEPFDPSSKRMIVVTRHEGRLEAHVKGSVETLLERCTLTEPLRASVRAAAESMSGQGLRVLLVAKRDLALETDPRDQDLCCLGLVGMRDPPRPGMREAVAACRDAGVVPVMITGDHPLTAVCIARDIGLWQEGDRVLRGDQMEGCSDADLIQVRVFARTTAEQKLRIVRAWKACGHVVAMTGDGVNDAPALREAHIGVAMGLGGADVAREAADLVLADDNFATIVNAIGEGRAIYHNIQKFIFFLLSSNMGLVAAVFIISLFPTWPPLTPLMLLWINLVTNGLPALALGVDPTDASLMSRPPRPPHQSILVWRDFAGMAYVGTVMAACAVWIYAVSPQNPSALYEARVLAFCVLALSPLFHAWNCRSPVASAMGASFSAPLVIAVATSAAIQMVAVLVPALRPVFHSTAVSPSGWLWIMWLSFLILPAVEIAKLGWRWAYASRPEEKPG